MCILRGWWMLSCPYADSILWPAGFFCLEKLVAHFDRVLELLSPRILGDIPIQLFQNIVVPLKLEVNVCEHQAHGSHFGCKLEGALQRSFCAIELSRLIQSNTEIEKGRRRA